MTFKEFRERIDARADEHDFEAAGAMASYVGELLAEGLTIFHVQTWGPDGETLDHGVYAREDAARAVALERAEHERQGYANAHDGHIVGVQEFEQQGRTVFEIGSGFARVVMSPRLVA